MAPRDSYQPKTPQEKLENIVSHKKHRLLEDTNTPTRIRSLLNLKRTESNTAEIIAYIAFPETKGAKSRGYLISSIISPRAIKDDEFHKLKSQIQKAEHLTEHTRLAVMNVLDDIRNT